MGLGFYTGLRNRNTRIRERKQEDKQAARDLWPQFDAQAKQNMKEIAERNRLAGIKLDKEIQAAKDAADLSLKQRYTRD